MARSYTSQLRSHNFIRWSSSNPLCLSNATVGPRAGAEVTVSATYPAPKSGEGGSPKILSTAEKGSQTELPSLYVILNFWTLLLAASSRTRFSYGPRGQSSSETDSAAWGRGGISARTRAELDVRY